MNKILNKNIDLVVAYLLIFTIGLVITFFMVNYLDSKVSSFTNEYEDMSTN